MKKEITDKLEWNVFREDINKGKIIIYNIFQHGRFSEEVNKLLKTKLTKEEFTKQLRRELQYYFWGKAEHEVVITSWPPNIDKNELDRLNAEYERYHTDYGRYPYVINVCPDVGEKIDIYDQVYGLNWNIFVDYVWSHKKEKER